MYASITRPPIKTGANRQPSIKRTTMSVIPPPTTQSRTDSLTLRGGRLRKTARGVLTFAPAIAATAFAALLSFTPTHSAQAQTNSCAESTTTGEEGMWTCAGTITTTRAIAGDANETLMVTGAATFNVASGNALTLTSDTNATGMTVNLTGAITTTGIGMTNIGDGINATHSGTGNISITSGGVISASGGGITAASARSADTMTVSANANVTAADGWGINAAHQGTGLLTVNLAAAATILADSSTLGNGISIETVTRTTGTGGVTIMALGSIGSSSDPVDLHGILTNHRGRGALSITSGIIHSGDAGIRAGNTDTGTDITVTTNGAIAAGDHGVFVDHEGTGAAMVTINAAVTSTSEEGISLASDTRTTTMTLNVNANVTGGSGNKRAILIDHDGTGDLDITIGSNATVSGTGGISADTMNAASNITLDLAGTVNATATSANAIRLNGGASQKLILNPGFSIGSGDTVTASLTNATLELKADAGASETFSLAALEHFTNFTDLDKIGAGIWTLTGTQPTDKPFTSADVMGGTLRLNAATLRLGSGAALTLAANTTLEVTGASAIAGNLDNSNGGISLSTSGDSTATDDTLRVTNFTTGGTLTLNADFTTGASDTLTITGTVTGSSATAITLMATGTPANLPAADFLTLVDVSGSGIGGAGDFTLDGFTLERNAVGDWGISGTASAGGATPVANDCEEDMTTGGTFTCSGVIAESKTLSAASGESLNVTGDNFTLTVATGNALALTGESGSTGMNVTLSGAISATAGDGIHADHNGNGAVSITAAAITAGEDGIEASTSTENSAAPTTMSITATAAITAGSDADESGIEANHAGSGNLTITANASISANTGIDATHSGASGNITISAADVTAATGINAAITGTDNTAGTISVELGGSMEATAATSPTAVAMMGGAGHTLRLRPGFSLTGAVTSDATDADDNPAAILELAANAGENGSFDLTGLANFSGFANLDKTGTGSWTLTGTQPANRTFASADVMDGTLHLAATTLELGGNALTLSQGVTLSAAGISRINGNLNNSAGAAISLALGDALDATDRLTIMGDFTAGGSVTLDVDLTGAQPASDQLILTNAPTGDSVTIKLRIAGNESLELTTDTAITADDPRSALVLVTAPANTPSTAFTQAQEAEDHCTVIGNNSGTCNFSLQQDATAGNWTLATLEVALAGAGDAQAAVVESYAASLADIAALSGLASRTANRHYANGNRRGFWAQIAAGQTDTTPSFSSTGSSRDTGITRARFGLDAPLPLADLPLENLAIGANFWLAQTDSDITSRNGKGDIETDTFGFAASATLEHSLNIGGAGGSAPRKNGSFYADAQLQHATFSSDLKAAGETVQSNHDATSWGAALELGYRLPPALHGISFTPQAQLTWSSIDFDAFTDASDARISIADGETLSARLGIAATAPLTAEGLSLFSPRPIQGAREARGWVGDGAGASTFLHASADILFPLDGETASNLGDSRLFSDMQDPALSLTAGGIFPLNATTTLAADLATTQGDEVEEYRATVSAHFAF